MAKKQKMSSFRGKVNNDSKRQQSEGNNFGYLKLPKGVQVYAPTPGGREKIDIIPYIITSENHLDKNEELEIAVKGGLWYKRPFKTHRGVGAENDTVICLQTFGEKCPICEYRKKRAKEGADKDELKAYNPSQRNLYFVIPRDVKKREEELHVMDISQFLFQNLLNEELSENEDFEVFPDMEEGLTLHIRWSKETFAGNTYAEAARIDFLERKEELGIDLEDVPSLDDFLKKLSYKDLSTKFFEMETDGEDEYDVETTKRPKKSVTSEKQEGKNSHQQTKKSVVQDDVDDEDVENESKKQITWEDLTSMEMSELAEVAEAYDTEMDIDDYNDEDDFRKALAEEIGVEITKKSPKKPTTPPVKEMKKENAAKPTNKNKCPFGYGFGKDTDDYEECEDCKLWDGCIDKKEEK